MKILICGDRDWTDDATISTFLHSWPKDTVIIHGDCRGADSIAGKIAKEIGLIVEAYPAQWTKYHEEAGPIRNAQMLDEGKPDMVVYFHHNLAESKGTKNMVMQANYANIRVFDGWALVEYERLH